MEASGPALDGELHVDLDDADFLAVFPPRRPRPRALIGQCPAICAENGRFAVDDHAVIVDDGVAVVGVLREGVDHDGLGQWFPDDNRTIVDGGRFLGQRRADDGSDPRANEGANRPPSTAPTAAPPTVVPTVPVARSSCA